jgi:hypothetical protein
VRLLLAVPLLVGALATGCGSDDDGAAATTVTVATGTETTPATTTDEPEAGGGSGAPPPQPGAGAGAQSPLAAAEAVLTTDGTVEQACGSLVTEAFIRTSYGGEQNCIAARRGEALARSIAVAPGSEETSGHLVVVPDGGPYDGHKVEVDLVEEDGTFRVDRLLAHVPAGP